MRVLVKDDSVAAINTALIAIWKEIESIKSDVATLKEAVKVLQSPSD